VQPRLDLTASRLARLDGRYPRSDLCFASRELGKAPLYLGRVGGRRFRATLDVGLALGVLRRRRLEGQVFRVQRRGVESELDVEIDKSAQLLGNAHALRLEAFVAQPCRLLSLVELHRRGFQRPVASLENFALLLELPRVAVEYGRSLSELDLFPAQRRPEPFKLIRPTDELVRPSIELLGSTSQRNITLIGFELPLGQIVVELGNARECLAHLYGQRLE
jgi:hypothetical protein